MTLSSARETRPDPLPAPATPFVGRGSMASGLRGARLVRWAVLAGTLTLATALLLSVTTVVAATDPNLQSFQDPSGTLATFSTSGAIDTGNPFFQSLGTNGRTCNSCHQASDGWTVTPPHIQARFNATGGTDPIFRPNDGSNSPNADVSSVSARQKAYSMLLSKGLIRVGLPIPDNAEFTLQKVDDPYGFASAKELSLFRRPLPSTNLKFLSTVMWDGRETIQKITDSGDLKADLTHQATDATLGHAQASSPPTAEQLQQIVAFETALFTAQQQDNDAGDLGTQGAKGGPVPLSHQDFFIGVNDPLGGNPTGAQFNNVVFNIFDAWSSLTGDRLSVARGESIFNNRNFAITGVGGLADIEKDKGHCTICHDAPNVGNHSLSAPLNIGLADASRRTPDMPLYTLRNTTTHETVQTTDPGRALISGKWADIGKFKGPILRGLAARAPYFHNGSAANLDEVVDFYNSRFSLGLSAQEHRDLVAFLRTL